MTDKENNKPRPAETLKDGNIKATIWRNEGEKGAFYNTKFSRSYQDLEGKHHESTTFMGTDVLKVGRLASRAYDKEQELRQRDRETYVREQQRDSPEPNKAPQKNHDHSR